MAQHTQTYMSYIYGAWACVLLCIVFLFMPAISFSAGIPLTPSQQNVQAPGAREYMSIPGNTSQGVIHMSDASDWRLRIRSAAVSHGDMVTLGEIAEPVGNIPPELWRNMSVQALWPSPPEPGKPLQISKMRLGSALHQSLGDVAARCILPSALVIQRGGVVLTEDALRDYVVRYLTPQLNALPGRAELTDFRLPPYIFLAHGQQQVSLEVGALQPGRVSFRFLVQESDASVLRRVAGTAFLDLWISVPSANKPLNKGDALHVQDLTFMTVNVAHVRGILWDGKGGPWQVVRALGVGEPIYQSDLLGLAMVRKGAIVHMLYEKGNIRMQVPAECLADGAPGEIIPVRNLQSKKQVYATIRDNKTVVVK